MKKKDRLDMLKYISFIGEKNLSIFSSYIPHRYYEIYTLYSLLDEASVNYRDVTFFDPIAKDNSFVFVCSITESDLKLLSKYLEKENNVFCAMRNKTFNIDINQDNFTQIIFRRV